MAPNKWPAWLPQGWTMQVKMVDGVIIECYLNPEGHKFYSNAEVSQYLETIKNNTPSEKRHNAGGSAEGVSPDLNVPHKDEVPGSLPQGWTTEMTTGKSGKKVKCYIDPESGRKFYSKPEVSRYLKTVNSSEAGEKKETHGSTEDGSSSDPLEPQTDEASDWLPDGWITGVKTRGGRSGGKKYKYFVDPVSGRKFFSKPEVLKYLATTNGSATKHNKISTPTGNKTSTEPDMSQSSDVTDVRHNIKKDGISNYNDNEVVSRTPADGLPPGWIKEIRIRKCPGKKDRKDPFYIDPLSGYVFRSKADGLRYLETGDIKKCAMKPTKMDINEKDSHNYDTPTGEKLASQPDLTKEKGISELSPNDSVVELKTEGRGTRRKATMASLNESPSDPDALQNDSEWLPEGWIVEVKTREAGTRPGMKYKCFTDPVTGRKFFSKPQVLNFLGIPNSSVPRQKRSRTTTLDMSPNSEATEVRHDTPKKSTNDEVISRTPAEGLPEGWIKEVRSRSTLPDGKKRKDPYYVDPLSGYMFRSKLDALRYLDSGDLKKCVMKPFKMDNINGEETHNDDHLIQEQSTPQPDINKEKELSESLPSGNVEESNTRKSSRKRKERVGYSNGSSQKDDVSEWLPDGWTVEVKTKESGLKYKIFTDPVSGRKFYSRPQVLTYLAAPNSKAARKRKNSTPTNSEGTDAAHPISKKRNESTFESAIEEVVSRTPADGLPPGWIKEIIVKRRGVLERKDPYYTDPVSGYCFRSRLDALRYLDTGDITICAIKPTKRDINENNSSIFSADGKEPLPVNALPFEDLSTIKEADNSREPQHNDIQLNDVQHNNIQLNDVQPNNAQHDDAQDNVVQHNNAQPMNVPPISVFGDAIGAPIPIPTNGNYEENYTHGHGRYTNQEMAEKASVSSHHGWDALDSLDLF